MKWKGNRLLQNIAVYLLIVIAIINLITAFPFKFIEHITHFYIKVINPYAIVTHHVFSFFVGLLMLLLAYRLYKRIHFAWVIEVIALSMALLQQLIRYHVKVTLPIVAIELFVLIVLLTSKKDFSRKSDRITIKKAFGFIGVSILIVLFNATIGLFIMRTHIHNIKDIFDAIISSAKLLVLMNTDFLTISGRAGVIYANSLIIINWICIIASVLFLLKPLVYNPIASQHDKEKVRRLVNQYGQNPMAYLSLEDDKHYFFGVHVEGVCSYQVVGNVFVVCGDMICNEKDGFTFLNEIMEFCHQNAYEILFLNITSYFYELYKIAGFGLIKYGEDACFNTQTYNLVGGKVAKVRAAINHANKAGIQVLEYKPLEESNDELEKQFNDITEEWLANKGGEEMQFMLGGTGLSDPLDRRYFYAVDSNDEVLGFVVFLPYLSSKAYLADVTRRKQDAPQGVIEKIIYDAIQIMRNEGVEWVNMGLSPLYKVTETDKATITAKLFQYIYENMNNSYGFKSLHHAKEKYAPTDWVPRYLAYSPRPFTPNFAYAMVRVQVGKRLAKIVLSEISKKANTTISDVK